MDIQTLWDIIQKGGVAGILFIGNVVQWLKNNKKDDQIEKLIGVVTKNTMLQEQSNLLLQKTSDNIIKMLGKD